MTVNFGINDLMFTPCNLNENASQAMDWNSMNDDAYGAEHRINHQKYNSIFLAELHALSPI